MTNSYRLQNYFFLKKNLELVT